MQRLRLTLLLAFALAGPGCALHSRRPPPSGPSVAETTGAASLPAGVLERRVGLASFYSQAFQGRATASGIPFDRRALVAAHPFYPFGTFVRVTNLANGRAVRVHIIDRGPTPENRQQGVIIDLSRRAAEVIGMLEAGRQRVRVDVLRWGAGASATSGEDPARSKRRAQ